jgi:protease secretion system outer membrane protein
MKSTNPRRRCGLPLAKPLFAALLAASLATPVAAVDLLVGYRQAIENDAKYQAARAETAAAREAEPQALAQLLPNVSASLMRSDKSSDIWTPNALGRTTLRRQDYFSSNYALTLRQPLYRRFNFVAYQQAQSQVSSAEANLDRSLQDLLVRLSASYFDTLMSADQLGLVLSQKEAYAAQLASAQRRFEAGQGTRTDIDDAQARYDMALAQELEAVQNVDYQRRLLETITHRPVGQLAPLVAERMELIPPYPADVEEWVRRGEEVNAELRALRANISAAEQEIAKAGAGHHPTLDLVAQRSKTQSDSETSINQEYLTNSVGLQLNIPLFAGGYSSSQVRQAEANLDKYRSQHEYRRREIGLAIRKEFQSVAQGVLKVRAQEQAERSAEQAVFSNQKGYQAGTRTQIDILNAQQQRMNVRRDLAQARYQYIMARIRLQGLVGALNEDELAAVNRWLDKTGQETAQVPEPSATVAASSVDAAIETKAAEVEGAEVEGAKVDDAAAAPASMAAPSALLLPRRQFERRIEPFEFKLAAHRCQHLTYPLIERCVPTGNPPGQAI